MMKAVALVLALCLAIYVSAEPGPHGPGGHGHGGGNGGHGGQGGGHEGGHGGGHGAPHPHPGPSMFVCHDDLQRFCPDFHPTSPNQLFESECFKSHEQELQPGCKKLMEEFRANGGHLPVPPPNPPTQPPNHPPHPPVGGTTSGSTESAEKPTPLQEACEADKYRFCSELKNPYDQASLYVILPTLMFLTNAYDEIQFQVRGSLLPAQPQQYQPFLQDRLREVDPQQALPHWSVHQW